MGGGDQDRRSWICRRAPTDVVDAAAEDAAESGFSSPWLEDHADELVALAGFEAALRAGLSLELTTDTVEPAAEALDARRGVA